MQGCSSFYSINSQFICEFFKCFPVNVAFGDLDDGVKFTSVLLTRVAIVAVCVLLMHVSVGYMSRVGTGMCPVRVPRLRQIDPLFTLTGRKTWTLGKHEEKVVSDAQE